MGRPPNPLGVTTLAKEMEWLPSVLLVYTLSGWAPGKERLGLQTLGLYLGLWGHWPNLPWGFFIPPFAAWEGVRPARGSEYRVREKKKAGPREKQPPCSQKCAKTVCMTTAPNISAHRKLFWLTGSMVGDILASKRPKFKSLCTASWLCAHEPL